MKNMKRVVIVVFVLLIATTLSSGCALYRSEKQYDEGSWYGVTGSGEVARIKENKLALKKLEATPTQIAVIDTKGEMVKKIVKMVDGKEETFLGYKGIVANMGTYRRYNYEFVGPEKIAVYLGPGQKVYKYLIPGKYTVKIYYGGDLVGVRPLLVGPYDDDFLGEPVHWKAVAEW